VTALDAFMATWSAARATFGDAAPVDGAQLDGRAMSRGREVAQSAAPGDGWSGTASSTYDAANRAHTAQLGAFADLDRRFGQEISRSAELVRAGRRDLESVRTWVTDAAATVPNNAAGQRMLWSIVGKGVSELQNVVARTQSDQASIAERVRAIAGEYELLGNDGKGGAKLDKPQTPDTRLDLNDIVRKAPYDADGRRVLGPPGYKELVPNTGVWVPDPSSPLYSPTPVEKPLDLDDIVQLGTVDDDGKRILGPTGYIELVPNSGTWVPDPNGPMWPSSPPTAPVDLTKIEIADPGKLGKTSQIELIPHSGVWVDNPHYGAPR
jgi:hypothetical protein